MESEELLWQKEERIRDREREDGRSLSSSNTVLGVHRSEVLLTMAGSLFGKLSLEEGDSANSLEGLDIKLGGEGKNRSLRAECVSV